MSHKRPRWLHPFAEALPELCEAGVAERFAAPKLVFFNRALAEQLDLAALVDIEDAEKLAQFFCGAEPHADMRTVAQAYSGHQFGHFSARLGDGRALLLGELETASGALYDVALKGSGRTPFSRGGDGRAAIGPMLREVLVSEALHALGIPCTRALAVVATGETIYRQKPLPGAVLTRLAASHIRIGSFEYVAASGDIALLRRLADFTIARHADAFQINSGDYLGLLRASARLLAQRIAQWMHAGFVHGVMNTDNVALSGESMDFGPCAWLEQFSRRAVFSSIDHHGRYAYGNQPHIAQWNLACLANAILPLLHVDQAVGMEQAREVLSEFPALYQQAWLSGARQKLGLMPSANSSLDEADKALADNFHSSMESAQADFALTWRALCDAADGNDHTLVQRLPSLQSDAGWLTRWRARCAQDDGNGADTAERAQKASLRAARMRQVNSWLIPRNHQVEAALTAASDELNFAPFQQLLAAISAPFVEDPQYLHLTQPAPPGYYEEFQTFCGT
jgi:serine/tyrosine/threonine adenylyltransferase